MKLKKVLIADDNTLITDLLEYALDRAGNCHVVTVHSNVTAAEAVRDNPDFSVAVLDENCLGEGGIVSVLRTTCPGCKILLYSGDVVGDEDPAGIPGGVDEIISKSAEPRVLWDRVIELCHSH